MSKDANVEKVQFLYQAFSRGDVPTVLEGLHPEIEWTNPGPSDLSYFGTHRGRGEIAQKVFAFLGENLDIHALAPTELLASDDTVVVLLNMDATARRTGKRFSQKVAHVWTFAAGWPVRFHDFQDSHAVLSALRG